MIKNVTAALGLLAGLAIPVLLILMIWVDWKLWGQILLTDLVGLFALALVDKLIGR